jgi:5-formyltetrahydrofolate cyclo-ligase
VNESLTIAERKAGLRKEIRQGLSTLGPEVRAQDSARIRENIQASDEWALAERVLGFVPLASEPDLLPLLRLAAGAGKAVCVPRWDPASGTYEAAQLPEREGLQPGPYGVLEPCAFLPSLALERLDLILVPGLAFDRHGWRLGRGRGFYDRLLRQAVSARRWGVAFDLQIVESVPNEPHDVNVHILVTPRFRRTATD